LVIRGLVFDLDDTLSDERDYVRSGFAHVARLVGTSSAEVAEISAWLWQAFESGVRGDTFDRLRSSYPEVAGRLTTDELVRAYRGHAPDIELIPGMRDMLDEIRRRGLRIGLLSDGPFAGQAAKVLALGLDQWFDPIVLTGALGPAYFKPAPDGFDVIARAWDEAGPALAYVADNPEKDFVGPRALGWATIRFRRPEQLRYAVEAPTPAHRPDVELATPAELLSWLRSVNDPVPTRSDLGS
jgi:putative hydrolase of the HAD superfamily